MDIGRSTPRKARGLLWASSAGLVLSGTIGQAVFGAAGCGDGASTGGAGGTGGSASSSSSSSSSTSSTSSSTSSSGTGMAFTNPAVCDPTKPGSGCTQDMLTHGRRVIADLEAASATRTFPVVDKTGAPAGMAELDLSLYNDLLPGPTIELQAGVGAPAMDADMLQIKLTNGGKLDVCCCDDMGVCPAGCPATMPNACARYDGETNIHTHGFHIASTSAQYGQSDPCVFTDPVSPDLPWDDVFVMVPGPAMTMDLMPCAGTSNPTCKISNVQQFVYPLPPHQTTSAFQPAPTTFPHWFGLEWYHPHMHTLTDDQVGRGMAGAIVVHNPVEDSAPALSGVGKDGDKIFVLQRLVTNDNSKVARLVNGNRGQVLSIQPGETQRWRILDATADNSIRFSVKDGNGKEIAYYPIGYDGVPLPAVGDAMTSYLLLPGNRLEVLFRAPADAKEGDTYQVTWCELAEDANHTPLDPLGPNQPCTGPTESVVTVRVTGAAVSPAPATLPGTALAALDQFGLVPDLWAAGVVPDAKHTIKFEQMTSGMTPSFTIDGVEFAADQACTPPFSTKLGQIEEWTLENWTPEVHTFHIHVNPFQAEPAPGATPYYQDNILLPPPPVPDAGPIMTPTQTKVRMKFVDYPGTAVFHCHVLFHEDHGMMAAFKVD